MSAPELQINGDTLLNYSNPVANFGEPNEAQSQPQSQSQPARPHAARNDTNFSKFSTMSVPPEGSILTGKQEHCRRHSHQRIVMKLTVLYTSSASSSLSRPISRSQNYLHLPPSNASALPSAQMPARSPRRTQSSPSFATFSYIMSATFHS